MRVFLGAFAVVAAIASASARSEEVHVICQVPHDSAPGWSGSSILVVVDYMAGTVTWGIPRDDGSFFSPQRAKANVGPEAITWQTVWTVVGRITDDWTLNRYTGVLSLRSVGHGSAELDAQTSFSTQPCKPYEKPTRKF